MHGEPTDGLSAVPPSRVVRLGRLLRPGGNPLARGVDRMEGTTVLLSVLLSLLLVPIMLTLGSETYASLSAESARQTGARYETAAVLTEDAPDVTVGGHGVVVTGYSDVGARWELPDGTMRTGLVRAENGLKAGAEVSVWLDDSGRPTTPPMSAADAAMAGVSVAVTGWLVVVGLLALACWGLHHALERRRYRAWEADWDRTEPDWHDRRR